MTQVTTPPASEPAYTFHRWRWLWVWLLLVGTAALLTGAVAATLNTVMVPAMLLFGALSGPIAFSTFVGDRADVDKSVSIFDMIMIVLFGGALGVLLAGTLNTILIKQPTLTSIWLAGPIEESTKLILPVALYLLGRRYRSVQAGLVLGLASAAGFSILETMGYGFNEVIKAGALFTSPGPLQGADRLELVKDFVAGGRTPIVRGLITPFGHLVWTGLITTVWWSEWQKHGGIRITRSVVGVLVLVMFLHSANDFVEFAPNLLPGVPWASMLLLGVPIIFILSFVFFWRTVKKHVPMKEYGKLLHRK